LIIDEKVALVDTVKKGFADDLRNHVKALVDPARIDYLVVNHVEMDHSGALCDMLRDAPGAVIVCTQKAREGLEKHYGMQGREFRIVKTGDTLPLGKRTLKFIAVPMIHWPDSMFTYVVEDRVLLPNDGFGQHQATAERFADEIGEDVCMEEAAKYYANILMPLGAVIAKKLQEIAAMNLAIDIIGPSHGAIWRKNIDRVIKAYQGWTAFEAKAKVTIVYDTMWESTEKLARRLEELIAASGVEARLYHIRKSDGSQIVRDILDSRVILVGSPTLNADMFWSVGGFLTYLRGLKPKNKSAGIFGSYGWAGGSSQAIRREVGAMGLKLIDPPFEVAYVPTEDEMKKLEAYADIVVQEAKA
jgi:flavorubredoxin